METVTSISGLAHGYNNMRTDTPIPHKIPYWNICIMIFYYECQLLLRLESSSFRKKLNRFPFLKFLHLKVIRNITPKLKWKFNALHLALRLERLIITHLNTEYERQEEGNKPRNQITFCKYKFQELEKNLLQFTWLILITLCKKKLMRARLPGLQSKYIKHRTLSYGICYTLTFGSPKFGNKLEADHVKYGHNNNASEGRLWNVIEPSCE